MYGLCGYILVKGSKLKAPAQNVIYPQHDYQNVIESSLPFERDPTTVMWNVELCPFRMATCTYETRIDAGSYVWLNKSYARRGAVARWRV